MDCNTDPCAEDCEYDWNTWSTCTVPCGSGTHSRTINIIDNPVGTGQPCPPSPETEPCNTFACGAFSGSVLLTDPMKSYLSSLVPGAFQLCYSSRLHTRSSSIFHFLCDGIPNTYSIMLTTRGNMYAGYTTLAWGADIGHRNDPNNPFWVTLINPFGYPMTQFFASGPESIYDMFWTGPGFGWDLSSMFSVCDGRVNNSCSGYQESYTYRTQDVYPGWIYPDGVRSPVDTADVEVWYKL